MLETNTEGKVIFMREITLETSKMDKGIFIGEIFVDTKQNGD